MLGCALFWPTTGWAIRAEMTELPRFDIDIIPSPVGVGSKMKLMVSGTWPDSCVPVLDSWSANKPVIDVRINTHEKHCLPIPTPYVIEVKEPNKGYPELPEAGVYRVRLLLKDANQKEHLVGFGLLPIGKQALIAPNNGQWWAPAKAQSTQGTPLNASGPGFGFVVEAQGDHLALTVLGFDAEGRSQWLWGNGTSTHNVFQMQLAELLNGRGPLADYQAPQTIVPRAKAFVHVIEPSTIELYLVHPNNKQPGSIDLQTYALVPFLLDQQSLNLSGAWLWVEEAQANNPSTITRHQLTQTLQHQHVFQDTRQKHTLECQPSPHYQHCLWLNQQGKTEAVFHHIERDRLGGQTADGDKVQLIREIIR